MLRSSRLRAPCHRSTRPWSALASALGVVWLAGCGADFVLPPDTGTGVRYPVALAVDPSQRWLYAVGADFDRAYHGGVVAVVDTVNGKIVQQGRVEVPPFASAALLDVDTGADGKPRRRLWVAARDDDSVTMIDVQGGDDTTPPTLHCGASGMVDCASAWRIGGELTGDEDLGADPVALAMQVGDDGRRVLHVAATGNGKVTPVEVQDRDGGGVLATLLPGLNLGSGLAALLVAPLSQRIYVADSRANRLHSYGLDDDGKGGLLPTTFTGVGLPRASSSEFGRGVALSSDEGRVYVAYRSPNALLVIDVAPTATGEPHDVLVDVIGLGGRPAQVVVAPVGPGGRDLVYVSCFGTDDIWVVDPELRRIVDVIRLSHSPYALAIANVPGRGRILYAALFSKHKIAAIPIDANAANRHDVLETIQ